MAAAALAGMEVDLEIFSLTNECVVTDLGEIKEKTETALKESLSLDETMCPQHGGALLAADVPVRMKAWKLFNVFDENVYETDLMSAYGSLCFPTGGEAVIGQHLFLRGPLKDERGNFCCQIPVQGGKRILEGTSIYLKIAFAVPDLTGNARILEKDILVDVKRKEAYGKKKVISAVG